MIFKLPFFISFFLACHFSLSQKHLDSSSVDYLLQEAEQQLSKNPSQAKIIGFKAIEIAKQSQEYGRLASCYKLIGKTYYYLGKHDSTKFYWSKSANILSPYRNKELSDAYNNLGVITQRLGESDSSLFYHQKALSIRKDIRDTLGIASSYLNLGVLHRNFGEFETALGYYLGSLQIYELVADTNKIGEAYNSIGLLYLSLKNPELSLEYLFKSLEIKKQFSDDRKIANTINNIAAVYHHLEDYDNAENYYLKAREVFEKYNDVRMLSGIESNLGIIYKERKNYDRAIESYLKSINSFKLINDPEGLASVYNNLGSIYFIKEQYQKSNDAYLSALDNAKKINSLPLLGTAYEGLFKTSKMLNQYELALEYNVKYVQVHDSIFSATTAKEIAELSEKYESEKKARKIDQLEKASIIADKKVQQREYFIWIISIIGCASVLVLLLVLNRYKLKRRVLTAEKERYKLANEIQERELASKNRELSSYASNTVEKGKFLQEIYQELENFQFKDNDSLFKANELKKAISSRIDSDDEWDKFKLHFESVHPSFFDNLKKQASNLTTNDLKNCAYIQMNLNVKEVAILLNISPKSAKMNRYRLKKKFGLEAEQSLSDFIHNI